MAYRLLIVLLALHGAAAFAVESQFDLLVDLDGSSSTGCTVSTPAGPFDGVESILSTFVETDGSDQARVVRVERRHCIDPAGDQFGPSEVVDAGEWPVGIGNGLDGFNVIETYLPLSHSDRFNDLRLALVARDDSGNDSVLMSGLGGEDIVLDGLPAIPVPLAGTVALGVLALLLLLTGLLILNRRGRLTFAALACLVAGGAAGAACVLDGEVFNWSMQDLLAETAASDPENGVDIRALFARRDAGGQRLCVRIDAALQFTTAPQAADDDYVTVETSLLAVSAADGLLDNDILGIPAAELASFGGGSLGGEVTDHGAGTSITVGADGNLSVQADGSFEFQAETGFEGDFTFEYRLENISGSSDATVTVQVQSPPEAVDDDYQAEVGQLFEQPAPGLLANDGGVPAPEVASFGGGDLGGTATDHAAGSSVSIAPDGNVEVQADGSLSFLPPTGHTGPFEFYYQAENPAGDDQARVEVTVNQAPEVTSDDSHTCEAGTTCEFDFSATGYPEPVITVQGDLPDGVSFDAADESLTGTPDAGTGGVWTMTVTAANGIGSDDEQSFTLTVNEAPSITSDDNHACEVGSTCSFTFEADGHPAATFDLPGLPAGLSLDSNSGELSGTPDAGTGGTYNLTLTAGNGIGSDDTQAFTLTVGEAPEITSADSHSCEVGSTCSFTLTATGLPDPEFDLPDLPDGLSLDSSSGELSGTPDNGTGGVYNLTATASNSVGSDQQSFTLTVNEAPSITSDDNHACEVGSTCSFTFEADGHPAATFDLPGLPAGLSLDSNSGELSGTPDAGTGGTYNLTLTAGNGIGSDDTQTFTLTVGEVPEITSADNHSCEAGSTCSFSVTADGHPDPTFSITSGTLPDGLSLAADGTLSGTPDAGTGGVYNLELTATNSIDSDEQPFTLTVNEAPTITSADTLNCEIGSACAFTVTADGHPEPTFSITSGSLPDGLSLAADGTFSGTPDAGTGGAYNLELTASNGIGTDGTQAFTLNVGQVPSITSADNHSCEAGSTCSFSVTADGHPDPTFSITSGTLPDGLSLAADGTLSGTPDAGTGGVHNLELTATNTMGDDDQSFELTVTEAPQANDNPSGGIPSDSSPGSMPYHGSIDTTLVVSDANGVLTNDTLGFPAASIANPTPTSANGGSVTLSTDGGFSYIPPSASFTGIDTFEYCLDDGANPPDCATVSVAIGERPEANDHNFPATLLGNTHVDTAHDSGFSLFSLTSGDSLSISVVSDTNGDAAVNAATGTFSFSPAAGHNGSASFQYSASNGFGSATGTVTFDVQGMVWYFDNSAASGGDGRLASPFNSLAGASSAAAGEVLFLHTGSGDYTGGITLLDNQTLVGHADVGNLETHAGQGAPDDSPLPPVSTEPVIANAGGHGIALGSGNAIHGLHVGDTNDFGVFGDDFGTLTVSGVSITGSGSGLHLDDGTVSGAGFDQVSATTGTHGILLTDVAGTVDLGGGAISGATTAALELNGGTADVNYSGTLQPGTGGRPALVQNKSGGTVALSGALDSTEQGVRVADNPGTTTRFAGGMNLSTGNSVAFHASGDGTVEVCDDNPCNPAVDGGLINNLSTTTATALEVINTTIGANHLEFRSISAGTSSNGPSHGILLDTTGTSGGLILRGTGSSGSGGLIRNTGDVSVLLLDTAEIELNDLDVFNSGNDGIRGQGVHNFALVGANLTDNGDGFGENGLQFGAPTGSVPGVTGTLTITDTNISGSAGNNVHIRNTSGTLDAMNVSGGSFNEVSGTTGANSFLFEMAGDAVTNAATIAGSSFEDNSPQRALEVIVGDSSTLADFTISNNIFSNNGIHASFSQQNTADLTLSVLDNDMQLADPLHAINVFSSSSSTGGSVTGTIDGNTIGDSAVASSGARGNGIRVLIQGQTEAVLLINDNTLRQIWDENNAVRGIEASFRGSTASGLPIVQSDITITNNDVDTMAPDTEFPLAAIFVSADDQGSPARVRADIRDNIAQNSVGGGSWEPPDFDGNGAHLVFTEEVQQNEEGQLVDTLNGADAQTQMENNNSATVYAPPEITLIPGPINTP
ncbi:putative Ig domain-containing protein [Wenzhouxiangella sp. AB-CW3]|uniref:putative Ig domain-containing protein n=1 Tax=Wenzhouxiangella sp. AB-CW3 TaxID=2771012 RepID=UPI00168BCF17|nr:putative Ig domain-containing protein [Wenzhouxiangella sp. AB-CW3]QOC22933.1 putative Ig domain-containing protein [Wenzhouxiangella sp. AB-CW3]